MGEHRRLLCGTHMGRTMRTYSIGLTICFILKPLLTDSLGYGFAVSDVSAFVSGLALS